MRTRIKTPTAFSLACLYFVILILLPSGSIYGINLKMITFVPVAIMAVDKSLKGKRDFTELAINFGILGIFLGWVFVSQVYTGFEFGMGLTQYKDVLTTLAGCWFVRIFVSQYGEMKAFIRLCLFTIACSSALKLLIFIYALVAGVSVSSVMIAISKFFGVVLMPMDLGEYFGRVEFTSDTLIPMCIFIILCMRKRLQIGAVASLTMVVLFVMSSFFTFSRVIWANAVVGIVLGLLAAKKDRMHVIYIGVTTVAVVSYYELVSKIIALRFSDEQAGSSDLERTRQNLALKEFFVDAPFFGHGLGSYSVQVIRSTLAPYSYESQVYALAGQVGIFGMILFVILLANYYRKAFTFRRGVRFYEFAVFLLLVAYLAGGFVNPTVLSSVSSVSYGLIFVLAYFGKFRDAR